LIVILCRDNKTQHLCLWLARFATLAVVRAYRYYRNIGMFLNYWVLKY
jgi:hypothetical protein